MILYVSKISNFFHRKAVRTEFISDYICVTPKYKKVRIENKNAKLLIDSGAFQDTLGNRRVTPEEALERQLKLEKKLGMIGQRIVAYDWIGNVDETVKANEFLNSKRDELSPRQLVMVIQGNTVEELKDCLIRSAPFIKAEDCVGFGGVAIAARNLPVRNKLYDGIQVIAPMLIEMGIKDLHLFGIGSIKVLRNVAPYCTGLNVSCDTSSYEMCSVMGKVLDRTGKWIKTYAKGADYHPLDLMEQNLQVGLELVRAI
jgi:queuine/archaeosine tRNA-ribosyltransferase